MQEKEPSATLYHNDTKNGRCIVLRHDGENLFELYMAKIRRDGRCLLRDSDMKVITKRQIMAMVELAQSQNKAEVEFKINSHLGELKIKRVEQYLQGVNQLLEIQNSWLKRGKKKKR